jgi:lipopolysaccharide/colanic/teichoic acid biosynthesis glycosyltransferase
MITNAPLRSKRYLSAMRGIRGTRHSGRFQEQRAAEQMKRLGDSLIALLFLAITFPLMIIAAVAIKLESPGPVLEKKSCIGHRGRRSQMLKFRTTMHDPERTIPAWAKKTTQVGQFLRYTRIEALPQLINVLRGDIRIIDTSLFD